MKQRKIYIAYTGGTIGMQRSNKGYIPAAGYLAQQMQAMPALQHVDMPQFTIHEYHPLIDSAEMGPANWQQIASDIYSNYDDYDGFIVLHGTDTMAYSASALSFMLEDLGKPVIFTGAQVPLAEAHTDARENLIGALLFACQEQLPEVCIFFNNKLYRGNRCQKVNANSYGAFYSMNYPALGKVALKLTLDRYLLQPMPKNKLTLKTIQQTQLAHIRLFPGFDSSLLKNLLNHPIQALIIQTYGIGNAPTTQQTLIETLEEATQRGIIIINTSQCQQANVDMSSYPSGRALQEIGVLSGFDMTAEAVITKLYYLFSKFDAIDSIKKHIPENLRGELTQREN